MKKIKYILIIILGTILTSCIEKDYFGEYSEADVVRFEIEKQTRIQIIPAVNNIDTSFVLVDVPNKTDLSNLKINIIGYSPLAYPSNDPLKNTDFTKPYNFTLTAENNKIVRIWSIVVRCESSSNVKAQLQFSSMTQWTQAKTLTGQNIKLNDGTPGMCPGDNSGIFSPWQTSAEANAFSLSGINYFTTRPEPKENTKYARMETIGVNKAYLINAKSAVVAGALFTGKFVFDIIYGIGAKANPRKMLDFGTSFSGKPTSVAFDMRYRPGDVMKDGKLQRITTENAEGRPLKDSCDIYFILQNREDPNNWVRVGVACLRTSETVGNMENDATGFKSTLLDFVYGKPTAAMIAEKPYLAIGGSRGELKFYKFTPTGTAGKYIVSDDPANETYAPEGSDIAVTHIIAMFSSSTYGDNFWAAVNEEGKLKGSTLDIKNVIFNYNEE